MVRHFGRLKAPAQERERAPLPLSAQHDLITVGIFAHCHMPWLPVFRLWLTSALAAHSDDFSCTDNYIGNLKSNPSPRLRALTAAVNGN